MIDTIKDIKNSHIVLLHIAHPIILPEHFSSNFHDKMQLTAVTIARKEYSDNSGVTSCIIFTTHSNISVMLEAEDDF